MSSSATDPAFAAVRLDEGLWAGSMTQQAILLGWTAADGADVLQGEHIAEVLVEGARHEIVGSADGRLFHQAVAASVLEPGDIIALIRKAERSPEAG